VAAASPRLVGVDAARGTALLAMAAVHVLPPADPDGSTSTAYLLVSGRAAALFAVLAGVGLGLATGRDGVHGRERVAASAGLVVRALAIGAVGLWLGQFTDADVAVILPYYAVLFALALPLLGLRPGWLWVVAVAAAVVVPVLSYALRGALPGADRANPTGSDLADPAGLLTELLLTGYYPALAWTAYLAAGLAAGRLELRSARVAGGLLAGGLALAVVARAGSALLLGPLGGRDHLLSTLPAGGLTAASLDGVLERSLYGNVPVTSPWWLAVAAPHSTTPLDLAHTTGTSLAVLGAVLLAARVVPALLRPLAGAGAVTLSLYSLHVVALNLGWGPADPLQLWLVHVTAALVLATVWTALVRRGPVEALVAWLSGAAADGVRGGPRRTLALNPGTRPPAGPP
jgi:uncharacterized membrane protein